VIAPTTDIGRILPPQQWTYAKDQPHNDAKYQSLLFVADRNADSQIDQGNCPAEIPSPNVCIELSAMQSKAGGLTNLTGFKCSAPELSGAATSNLPSLSMFADLKRCRLNKMLYSVAGPAATLILFFKFWEPF